MQLFGEHDGANYQARAVLAVLSARSLKEMPENSWERPRVERWFNCWETSKDVKPGQYDEMADWIMERLEAFAEARKPRKPEAA